MIYFYESTFYFTHDVREIIKFIKYIKWDLTCKYVNI